MLRAVAVCLLVLCTAAPVFAQDSRRSRGFSNAYRSQIEALGSQAVQNLPVPIYGIPLSALTRNFGDPRGDGTRSHEGLDIMASNGTPIASPTDAVVTRAGNGSSSGLYVRTANPGGETFVYMHLSKIGEGIVEGKVMKRGDIIGFVGNTGNASGGAAHLHFEIRSGRTATDPYPRLNSVFTAAENDRIAAAARGQGASVTTPTPATNGSTYLREGDSGARVVQLQEFLITKNAGAAALRLKTAGATGYFGPVTVAALKEYQTKADLDVTGYVDARTNQLVFASASEGTSDEIFDDEEDGAAAPGGAAAPTTSFSRDLERGMEGEDVRALQKFLNSHGFTVAASGVGSIGNETTFFGPATQAAVVKLQKALGITPQAGYFGPKTRAAVAAL